MRTKAKVTAQAKTGSGHAMRAVLGAALVAAALYAVLAAPGLLVDEVSTVPARHLEARR